MKPLIPGPRGNWKSWKFFHETLKEFLHEEDVLHTFTHLCELSPARRAKTPLPRAHPLESPWCLGSCNMLATVLTLWINDHDRVERWMIARRGRYGASMGPVHAGKWFREYAHTVISYRSDVLGPVYFDALVLTDDPDDMAQSWSAHHLRRVDKPMLRLMNENYRLLPDKETVEKLVMWLNHMLGRWPKAKPFGRPMPWDKLEGLWGLFA